MRSLSSIRLPIFLKIATGLSVAILLGATLALMVQSRISIAPLRQHLQQMAADLAEEGVSKISRPGYGAVYHGENGACMHWGGDGGTWAERKVRHWQPPAGAVDV